MSPSEGVSKSSQDKGSARSEGVYRAYYSEEGRGGATWGHPQFALKLSAWLNSDFEVWVYATIEKLLKEGRVELENEIDNLRSALDITKSQIDQMWNDSLLNDLESRYPEYLEPIDD